MMLVEQMLLMTFLFYHQTLDCKLSLRVKAFRMVAWSTKVRLALSFLLG